MGTPTHTRDGLMQAIGQAIKDWYHPKPIPIIINTVLDRKELSGLVTWIALRANVQIVQRLPDKMTVTEIVALFQKAAGV